MPASRLYTLGLDSGASSVGSALIGIEAGERMGLIDAGVRLSETGLAGDLERGRAEPCNVKRKQARQARRQTDRRQRRLRRIFRAL